VIPFNSNTRTKSVTEMDLFSSSQWDWVDASQLYQNQSTPDKIEVFSFVLFSLVKRTLCTGKSAVFTFVLCPHTTPPLDLFPWKMRKTQVYKSH
jgi:hypothetical protein